VELASVSKSALKQGGGAKRRSSTSSSAATEGVGGGGLGVDLLQQQQPLQGPGSAKKQKQAQQQLDGLEGLQALGSPQVRPMYSAFLGEPFWHAV